MSLESRLVHTLVDPDRLASFMDRQGLVPGRPIQLTRITSGHSNEVFKVERGELTLALRRPPRVGYGPGAHDMRREQRVLAALAADPNAKVPVPRIYAFSDDPDVLGAPFILMELLDGVVARDESFPAALAAEDTSRDMGFAMIDTLAALHDFDWRNGDLADLGRPEGFLQRQTDRWYSMLANLKGRSIPALDDAAAWLTAHVPKREQNPTLIHWDYKLDNVMWEPALPIRIQAIVDWEVATIGDPLIDLGWLLGGWRERSDRVVTTGANRPLHVAPSVGSIPTRDELAARYATHTGRDLTDLSFYVVLGLFKLAVLMEAAYMRHLAGGGDDPLMASMEREVPALAEQALRLVD